MPFFLKIKTCFLDFQKNGQLKKNVFDLKNIPSQILRYVAILVSNFRHR